MDKFSPEKSTNFSSRINENSALGQDNSLQSHQLLTTEYVSSEFYLSTAPLLKDVDKFLEAAVDKSNPSQVPKFVESFLEIIERKLVVFDHCQSSNQKEESEEEYFVHECLTRVSKMIDVLNDFNSNSSMAATFNRATIIMRSVLSQLEGSFRVLLENCSTLARIPESRTPKSHEFPGYSSEEISNMRKIVTAMITLGFEKECRMEYNMIRRNAFNAELDKLGFNNISVDDVKRMQWQSLEAEMVSWIQIFKHCLSVLFPSERKLCDSVFSKFPLVSQRLFGELASSITVRFLNFAEAVTSSKRSTERLFKFLDMYETLRDVINQTHTTDSMSEIRAAKARLGEAAVSIFCDLENSIRRDNSKTPVPSGAVHPLTRYTMNYLRYACEYKDTLEQVFLLENPNKNQKPEADSEAATAAESNEDGTPRTSPFAMQLNAIMELLDENLEMKSKLYKDPSLGYIFLMNNGRYILQKIKGSEEINDIMGATWCRKRTTDLRSYHKGYQRETWGRLLQCLSHEGLHVNGKVVKPALKERFKMFNATIEEIHKTQTTWVVGDKQLQSELRVSISAVIIPAYRSFLGRFHQFFTSRKQSEKYIKYQPEDLENLIEELFDGNPNSIPKRRS